MNGSNQNSPDSNSTGPNESNQDVLTPNESDPDLSYDDTDPDLAYDPDTRGWRARYDPARTPTTYAVLASVARLAGTEATDLPLLADAVDPDSLDRLAASLKADGSSGSWGVEFEYAGYVVVLDGPASLLIGEAAGRFGSG